MLTERKSLHPIGFLHTLSVLAFATTNGMQLCLTGHFAAQQLLGLRTC